MKIAIIGTRSPTDKQTEFIKRYIESLNKESDIVISGCAYGVDELALRYASSLGIETHGCIPWNTYNVDVQAFCKKIFILSIDDIYALSSVDQYHPAPQYLSMGARKLHGRNYRIIYGADKVIAAPSNSLGLGGTGQGIRIAIGLDIPLTIVGNNGQSLVGSRNFSDIVSFVNKNAGE